MQTRGRNIKTLILDLKKRDKNTKNTLELIKLRLRNFNEEDNEVIIFLAERLIELVPVFSLHIVELIIQMLNDILKLFDIQYLILFNSNLISLISSYFYFNFRYFYINLGLFDSAKPLALTIAEGSHNFLKLDLIEKESIEISEHGWLSNSYVERIGSILFESLSICTPYQNTNLIFDMIFKYLEFFDVTDNNIIWLRIIRKVLQKNNFDQLNHKVFQKFIVGLKYHFDSLGNCSILNLEEVHQFLGQILIHFNQIILKLNLKISFKDHLFDIDYNTIKHADLYLALVDYTFIIIEYNADFAYVDKVLELIDCNENTCNILFKLAKLLFKVYFINPEIRKSTIHRLQT